MQANPLPPLFAERLKGIVPPADYLRCLDSFSQVKEVTFRLLQHVPAAAQTPSLLTGLGLSATPVPGLPQVYRIPAAQKTLLTRSAPFAAGSLYIQSLSSMLPALLLAPAPTDWVADLTAAPGGKTIHLAELMHNQGKISAVEQVRSRYYKLKANLEKHHVHNTRCYHKDSRWLWKQCKEQFDRILLDAPCSSEARFSTLVPESMKYWSIRKIREMARKQKQLLYSAAQCLKPGGTLVYSTCSFAPEENEMVIQHLLKKMQGSIRVSPIDTTGPLCRQLCVQPGLTGWMQQRFDPSLSNAIRILPDEQAIGFFVCRLVKEK